MVHDINRRNAMKGAAAAGLVATGGLGLLAAACSSGKKGPDGSKDLPVRCSRARASR